MFIIALVVIVNFIYQHPNTFFIILCEVAYFIKTDDKRNWRNLNWSQHDWFHKIPWCKQFFFLVSQTGARDNYMQCIINPLEPIVYWSDIFKETYCFSVRFCLNMIEQKGLSQNIASKLVTRKENEIFESLWNFCMCSYWNSE